MDIIIGSKSVSFPAERKASHSFPQDNTQSHKIVAMLMTRLASFLPFVVLLSITSQCHAHIRRCFACRSRGERGDCKDSFRVNQTLVVLDPEYQRQVGIKAIPCASGWCGKIIDGGADKDDFDQATERICIQRPPTDGEERCADTVYGSHRKVFMCFCRGDLCNAATPGALRVSPFLGFLLAATSLLVVSL